MAQQAARREGRPDEAMELAERALAIQEATLGPDDPGLLSLLSLRVRLATEMGDRARTERAHERLLSYYRKRFEANARPISGQWIWRLGPPPDTGALRFAHRWSEFATRESYANALAQRASFPRRSGRVWRAGQWMREAMDAHAENFERQAAVAQEQVHFDPMSSGTYVLAPRPVPDPLARSAGGDHAGRGIPAGAVVEGRVLRLRATDEAVAEPTGDGCAGGGELRETSARLAGAAMSRRSPRTGRRGPIVAELAGRRLEGQIADRVSALSEREDRERPGVERLKDSLPERTGLVDFKVFTAWPGWGQISRGRKRLMAFVVRPEGPVVRLDLGAWMPLAAAVADWRRTTPSTNPALVTLPPRALRREGGSCDTTSDRAIVGPLRPHLKGVDTILASPDGELCKFPLGALAGTRPGTFLIEELAIAVAPVPQLLLEGRRTGEKAGTPSKLVAVGEVDFGAEPGRGPRREGAGRARAEAGERGAAGPDDEIRPVGGGRRRGRRGPGSLRGCVSGRGGRHAARAAATEGRFGRLVNPRFVHLATHGFSNLRSWHRCRSRPGTTWPTGGRRRGW